MLTWVLTVAGGLVGLIAVIVLIGLMIPKAHVAARTVRFSRSAQEVWDVVSDFEGSAAWRPEIRTVEMIGEREGHPVWRETRKRGDTISAAIIERDPPRRLVTKIVDQTQFGGTWTWSIEPEGDDACRLTITEDGEIYNPFFRVVARLIMGYHATIDGYLRALGTKLGEAVELDAT